jgi:hypothetical protein
MQPVNLMTFSQLLSEFIKRTHQIEQGDRTVVGRKQQLSAELDRRFDYGT